MLSRPKADLTDDEITRREIIRATYSSAKVSGDQNVYFMDGKELMYLAGDEGTVDSCHPNDLGFYSMASALIPLIKSILCK